MPILDRPECGFWKGRMVKGGPQVPMAIQMEWMETEPGVDNPLDRGAVMTARICGEIVRIAEVWERKKEPISASEYRYLCSVAEWARTHSPDDPIANPRKRIDLMTAELPF